MQRRPSGWTHKAQDGCSRDVGWGAHLGPAGSGASTLGSMSGLEARSGLVYKDSQGNTSGTERPAPRGTTRRGHRPPDSDWCPGPRRAPRLSPHSLVPPVGFYTTNNFTKKRALKGKDVRPGEGHVAEQVPSSGRAGCGKLGTLQTTSLCSGPREQHHLPGPVSAVGSGAGGALSLRAPSSTGPQPPDELGPQHTATGSVGPCTLNSAHPFYTVF